MLIVATATITGVALALVLASTSATFGQSLSKDNGNCATASGQTVFACWNLNAGKDIPESLSSYPEFLPFLTGWDFRINLPHVRFQPTGTGSGSPAAMVGVIEDATPATDANGTLRLYGHKNNSIWIFRVSAGDGRMYAKSLPSRRDLGGSTPENVTSLTTGWARVGPLSTSAPELAVAQPAAAVVGEGLGKATVYLVSRRASDGMLVFAHRLMSSASPSWSSVSWSSLGSPASSTPSLVAAFDGRVAVAWRNQQDQIAVRLFQPATETWGPVTLVATPAAGDPQLVWDGSALDLFFVAKSTRRIQHAYFTGPDPLTYGGQAEVAATAVAPSRFHAVAWNGRLHVVFVPDSGSPDVQYTVSRTGSATRSQWVAPSPVGFQSNIPPRLAAFGDELLVVGASGGKVRYARKDPNRRGPESTGAPVEGLWLDAGSLVDPKAATWTGTVPLAWNGDVYLGAVSQVTGELGYRLYLVNLSRDVMKQLITAKWGMNLRSGALGGGTLLDATGSGVVFAKGDEIPMLGDFNGDGESDLVKFTQQSTPGVGPAPVYVALAGDWRSRVWHRFFSLKGEIPLVGDFNGDGKDDIATFVQKEQKYADGTPIGPAPVWVALSDGTKFQTSRVWHRFFSLKGEIPLVGDFNGDGKDDIATFVQKEQKYADGTLLGHAPVWVALSDGTMFQTSRVWHRFFSLKGEIPRVGDFNFDGRDDIATFVHGSVSGERARNVFVALSRGSSFGQSFTWMSEFAGKDQVPAIGTTGGRLGQVTGRPEDANRRTPDLFAFNRVTGAVSVATSTSAVPYPAGAPWERYKWFTDKAFGVAEFPEWVWHRPNHCIGSPHSLVLLGAAGSGGPSVTNLSVRMGSRAGHVLEELGHSLFANCFRKASDPMHAGIYTSAGIDAGDLWGGGPHSSIDCPGGMSAESVTPIPPALGTSPYGFYDCRHDIAEHYFLALLIRYRLDGDEFRALIRSTSDPSRKTRLTLQYNWFKQVWFNGAEYRRGPAVNASLTQDGLLCLPGECAI
jgi:hypothetical protein